MKRLLLLLLVATVALSLPGCKKMKEDIRNVKERVDKLEEKCEAMNDEINSLEQLIVALQNNDYVTAVTPVVKDGVTIGYTISFSKSGHITIYNGESGSGSMPVIGVKMASDGIYYWTVNGEWLLDEDGNKVAAGGNSATPKLKIENGYLYVSYDNGNSWSELGQVSGSGGDSIFSSVTQDEYNVYFTLADGTVITIPLASSGAAGSLQSISYIPRYSDGKATILYSVHGDSETTLEFELFPKGVTARIASNWSSKMSLKATYTTTRAAELVDLPILSCVADAEKGIITIKASGENLSDDFFAGVQGASVRLSIKDGDIDVASDYIPLTPVAKDQVTNFQITYTTSDHSILQPYRTNDFGAEIVSNIYANGVGMISFDREITRIGADAFYNSDKLVSITIPETVKEIGDSAFLDADYLTSITLPEGLTSIGHSAFSSMDRLESIYIPSSVVFIDGYAFNECIALTEVTIPEGVKELYNNCFSYCKKLVKATLPNTITKIYNSVFYGCTKLSEVSLPTNLITLGSNAFYGCESLKSIEIPSKLLVISEYAFHNCKSLESLVIPDNITTVNRYAFAGCSQLSSVHFGTGIENFYSDALYDCGAVMKVSGETIPASAFYDSNTIRELTIDDSVVTIGDRAFYSTNLESVTFGANVKTLGNEAFEGCTYLMDVTLNEGLESIGNDAFEGCDNIRSLAIPNSVKTLGNYAFSSCDLLSSITLGSGITSIGEGCFRYCIALSSIVVPAGVKELQNNCFNSCNKLKNVTLPEGLKVIRYAAFSSCPQLGDITIPSTVHTIEHSVFTNSVAHSITCLATVPPVLGQWAFSASSYPYTPIGCPIYVPAASYDSYLADTAWSAYKDYIQKM